MVSSCVCTAVKLAGDMALEGESVRWGIVTVHFEWLGAYEAEEECNPVKQMKACGRKRN